MNKKILIPLIAVIAILVGGIAWLAYSLYHTQQEKAEMVELAALDKQEMENEYERFTLQYSEMMTKINNDSIVEQLTQEQLRTQQLLEELKKVKADDAREITRLKKELATVRAVLRSYVLQIDSLNQLNEQLKAENSQVKEELAESNRNRDELKEETKSLSAKVAIAAQLDATNISLTMLKKREKVAKKLKDCKILQVSFKIARNVTAQNGQRALYVRIKTPTGNVLRGGGSFSYENRQLDYTMKRIVEYDGEEKLVDVYWEVDEYLAAGDYRVDIFADGQHIGSRTFAQK